MAQKNVDLSKFNDCVRKLAELSGNDLKTVLVAEAGKILETAVRYTPKADAAKLKAQVEASTKYDFENQRSDAGHYYKNKKNGKEWFAPGPDREKWYLIMDWHVPNKVWKQFQRVKSSFISDFKKTLRRRIAEAMARRGLTAKTWIQIGEAIKSPPLNVPGYVAKAKIPEGIGSGYVSTDTSNATVSGTNESAVMIKTHTGNGIINRAIRARVKYAEVNIKKGALLSLKSRARAYPEIFKEAA